MLQRHLLVSAQCDPNLFGNGASYLVLERECVSDIPFIALGPDVLVGTHVTSRLATAMARILEGP
jgi:hypothetical protein